MAKYRVKKQKTIDLDHDVLLFEPHYKRLHDYVAFAPGGIDFYGTNKEKKNQTKDGSEIIPGSVREAMEVLYGRLNRPGGIADKFASSILKIDDIVEGRLDSFIDTLEDGVASNDRKNEARERGFKQASIRINNSMARNKKEFAAVLVVLLISLVALTSLIESMTVYEYGYYGYKLGYAETKREVYETIDLIESRIENSARTDIIFNKYEDVTFTKVVASGISVDTGDDILDNFTYLRNLKGSGIVILINGERKVLVESEATAKKVMSDFKDQYAKDTEDTQNESSEYIESITMQPIETEVLRFKNYDDALELINTGGNGGTPLATVETLEINISEEAIPFETTFEESAEMYIGETEVKKEGEEGKREITSRVKRHNGKEIFREELNQIITKQPDARVIIKGTKKIPVNLSGKLIDPATNQVYYKNYIVEHAEAYGLDPYLVMAIINTESRFNKDATSSQGARGLMQMTGSTGYWVAKAMGIKGFDPSDLYDPKISIKMGCWYMNYLKKEFGTTELMLAAYNAGPGNVNKWLRNSKISADGKNFSNIPYAETRAYIKKVMNDYRNFKLIL